MSRQRDVALLGSSVTQLHLGGVDGGVVLCVRNLQCILKSPQYEAPCPGVITTLRQEFCRSEV